MFMFLNRGSNAIHNRHAFSCNSTDPDPRHPVGRGKAAALSGGGGVVTSKA